MPSRPVFRRVVYRLGCWHYAQNRREPRLRFSRHLKLNALHARHGDVRIAVAVENVARRTFFGFVDCDCTFAFIKIIIIHFRNRLLMSSDAPR